MTYGEILRAMGARLALSPESVFRATAPPYAALSEPYPFRPVVSVTRPNLASLCVPSDPPVSDEEWWSILWSKMKPQPGAQAVMFDAKPSRKWWWAEIVFARPLTEAEWAMMAAALIGASIDDGHPGDKRWGRPIQRPAVGIVIGQWAEKWPPPLPLSRLAADMPGLPTLRARWAYLGAGCQCDEPCDPDETSNGGHCAPDHTYEPSGPNDPPRAGDIGDEGWPVEVAGAPWHEVTPPPLDNGGAAQ